MIHSVSDLFYDIFNIKNQHNQRQIIYFFNSSKPV